MFNFRSFVYIAIIIFSLGCSYPVSNVNQGGERPALIIKGADPQAELYLDGLSMGPASNFSGKPNKLLIETGAHHIRIVEGGQVTLEQNILVTQGETKVIDAGK